MFHSIFFSENVISEKKISTIFSSEKIVDGVQFA